jgi:hypothetical protein
MITRVSTSSGRLTRFLLVLAVPVLLQACASPRAYPRPSGDLKAELKALVRQAKLGASGRVHVPAAEGPTSHASRVWHR